MLDRVTFKKELREKINNKINYMPTGIIKTFGKKAITIINDDKLQYYAPLEDVEELIHPFLKDPFTPIKVTFDINYKEWSGNANGNKRYFAYNVKISDTIVF